MFAQIINVCCSYHNNVCAQFVCELQHASKSSLIAGNLSSYSRRCCTPMSSLKRCSLSRGSGLVMMSATMSLVGHQLKRTCCNCTRWREKWYWTSMCLARWCRMGFLTSCKAAWLSVKIKTGWYAVLPSCKSTLMLFHQSASFTDAAAAIYSASVVLTATVFCNLLLHDTAPPATLKT